MKTIGLIGGMSWESTALYYQSINWQIARRLGGLHSAKLLMASLNFAEIANLQQAGDWDTMTNQLSQAAQHLEQAGADCILIATNTMHKIAPAVAASISVPLLHIADATAQAIRAQGLQRVTLLGTRFTMEETFYRDHLRAHGIECLIPSMDERAEVHRIIFEELCQGQICADAKARLLNIIENQQTLGTQGVILGCTELPLLIQAGDTTLPVLDTTQLHATAAVAFARSSMPASV